MQCACMQCMLCHCEDVRTKMADSESFVEGGIASSNSSECRSTSNSDGCSTITDDFDLKKSGWLLKKSRFSKKWKKKWFSLNGTELVYGESAEMAKKFKVPLSGTGIASCPDLTRSNTFKLKPGGRRRPLVIQAETETDQQEWMESICFAKAASHDKKQTLCAIQ